MTRIILLIGRIDGAFLALILGRGCRNGFLGRFPVFYSYLAADCVGSLLMSFIHYQGVRYIHWYWIVDFATLFAGCAVLWDMFTRMWIPFMLVTRAAKLGRSLLIVMIAAATAMFVFFQLRNPLDSVAFRHLETDCRAVQAIFFIVIVSPVLYYGIPLGRHFKAICLGYGLYVLVSLISLALLPYARVRFAAVLVDLQPASFDMATAIWLIGLWNADRPVAMFAEQPPIREERFTSSCIRFAVSKAKSALKAELA